MLYLCQPFFLENQKSGNVWIFQGHTVFFHSSNFTATKWVIHNNSFFSRSVHAATCILSNVKIKSYKQANCALQCKQLFSQIQQACTCGQRAQKMCHSWHARVLDLIKTYYWILFMRTGQHYSQISKSTTICQMHLSTAQKSNNILWRITATATYVKIEVKRLELLFI